MSDSAFMIVLLTENGRKSQWVNQEVGFAYALKLRQERQHSNLPYIIPLSEKTVEKLKGFISRDSTDILFLDKHDNFELVVADIFSQIRWRIPKGYDEGTLHHRVTCENCTDQVGLSFEWSEPLPSQDRVVKAIESNQIWIRSTCPNCKMNSWVDARTFLPHTTKG